MRHDEATRSPGSAAAMFGALLLAACGGDSPARDGGGGDDAAVTPGDAGQRPDAAPGQPDSGSSCPYANPAPAGAAPLPGESPAGRFEVATPGSFDDDYLYNADDDIKVGVRRQWGGTIVFFGLGNGSPGMNNTNTIDANDTGREVQVAFYDPDRAMQGCADDASCRTTPSSCPASITYLGWNPVQGGNRCNNGSGIDEVNKANGVLEVVTTPLHWNPNWDDAGCTSSGCSNPALEFRRADVEVTQRLRFVRKHIVELEYEVKNLAAIDHASTLQEMPTLYTANGNNGPDLWRLFDSSGTQVPIDVPAGNEDGFMYKNFDSPGPWVTMQNDGADYGVGILYENGLTAFQGWQLRSLPFNNVRARFPFGIPASGTVRARAYLILGSLGTVTSEATWLEAHLAPFGYLDTPAPNATVSGATAIAGWALDNRGVTSVKARIDESIEVPLTYGSARADVCLVWPGYPGCGAVGFTGSYDFGPATECPRLLEIVATDADGNERVIARSAVYPGG